MPQGTQDCKGGTVMSERYEQHDFAYNGKQAVELTCLACGESWSWPKSGPWPIAVAQKRAQHDRSCKSLP